jgi:hypothetical protein
MGREMKSVVWGFVDGFVVYRVFRSNGDVVLNNLVRNQVYRKIDPWAKEGVRRSYI